MTECLELCIIKWGYSEQSFWCIIWSKNKQESHIILNNVIFYSSCLIAAIRTFLSTYQHTVSGYISICGVTVLMLALSTDCTCSLLPSELPNSFRIVCVKICDDYFLSLSATPWNVAIHIWRTVSSLPVWVLPRGSRDRRGQNQDEPGD